MTPRKTRGCSAIPRAPLITGRESSANIKRKIEAHFKALRCHWKQLGIEVDTTESEAQLIRLGAILRAHGSRGLGSLEGRAAGGFVQLPTRIFELKERGWKIESVREGAWGGDGLWHVGTVRYFLIKEPPAVVAA
ncbi:helix-turn-helix domain-containing protein [Burkholderia sp. Ac-20353]|uniref:helix-turn-helix domain-containing protein n=1 Tax=Burkholderia sp. Ac-20353 TaxID=2703894 RepID=UPI00197C1946|nr:helix-turn-helix domain-containing protein [Burkholderia sp. Ac-20353]MBN3788306.1 hypothetical protein [Burkholderia sp. Ac-20353]